MIFTFSMRGNVLFSTGRKDTKRVKSKLEMIYTHLKCSNKFKLRCYAMLPHCRATLRLPPQTPILLLGNAGARRAPRERPPA